MLFLCRRSTGRSRRRCRDMDDRSRRKGVRGIDDYLVGFSDTVQDLGLYAKVSADFYVMELHNAVSVHYANLQIFAAKYKGVVRQDKQFP